MTTDLSGLSCLIDGDSLADELDFAEREYAELAQECDSLREENAKLRQALDLIAATIEAIHIHHDTITKTNVIPTSTHDDI